MPVACGTAVPKKLTLVTPGPVKIPAIIGEYLLNPPCNYHRQDGFKSMFEENQRDIKRLLGLRDAQGPRRSAVRELAAARMKDIDQKVARLQAMRGALRALVESCACDDSPRCPIIEALDDSRGPEPGNGRADGREVGRRVNAVRTARMRGRGEVE